MGDEKTAADETARILRGASARMIESIHDPCGGHSNSNTLGDALKIQRTADLLTKYPHFIDAAVLSLKRTREADAKRQDEIEIIASRLAVMIKIDSTQGIKETLIEFAEEIKRQSIEP